MLGWKNYFAVALTCARQKRTALILSFFLSIADNDNDEEDEEDDDNKQDDDNEDEQGRVVASAGVENESTNDHFENSMEDVVKMMGVT